MPPVELYSTVIQQISAMFAMLSELTITRNWKVLKVRYTLTN